MVSVSRKSQVPLVFLSCSSSSTFVFHYLGRLFINNNRHSRSSFSQQRKKCQSCVLGDAAAAAADVLSHLLLVPFDGPHYPLSLGADKAEAFGSLLISSAQCQVSRPSHHHHHQQQLY